MFLKQSLFLGKCSYWLEGRERSQQHQTILFLQVIITLYYFKNRLKPSKDQSHESFKLQTKKSHHFLKLYIYIYAKKISYLQNYGIISYYFLADDP